MSVNQGKGEIEFNVCLSFPSYSARNQVALITELSSSSRAKRYEYSPPNYPSSYGFVYIVMFGQINFSLRYVNRLHSRFMSNGVGTRKFRNENFSNYHHNSCSQNLSVFTVTMNTKYLHSGIKLLLFQRRNESQHIA